MGTLWQSISPVHIQIYFLFFIFKIKNVLFKNRISYIKYVHFFGTTFMKFFPFQEMYSNGQFIFNRFPVTVTNLKYHPMLGPCENYLQNPVPSTKRAIFYPVELFLGPLFFGARLMKLITAPTQAQSLHQKKGQALEFSRPWINLGSSPRPKPNIEKKFTKSCPLSNLHPIKLKLGFTNIKPISAWLINSSFPSTLSNSSKALCYSYAFIIYPIRRKIILKKKKKIEI